MEAACVHGFEQDMGLVGYGRREKSTYRMHK